MERMMEECKEVEMERLFWVSFISNVGTFLFRRMRTQFLFFFHFFLYGGWYPPDYLYSLFSLVCYLDLSENLSVQ